MISCVFVWRSYKENLGSSFKCKHILTLRTQNSILDTCFHLLLNTQTQQRQRSLQYVGRTTRGILPQLSGTADGTFHLYYFTDKTESSALQLLQHTIQVKYVNLRTNYGFRTVSSSLLMAMISTTHKRNGNQQLIVQYLKSHSSERNYYKYLLNL